MNKSLIFLFCFIALLGPEAHTEKTLEESPDPVVQIPPPGKVPRALVMFSSATSYAFVVDKNLRTLSLWKNSKVPSLVAAYPTDMGKNKGNKLYQGDHKTPEGIYFFQESYKQPYLDFSQYGQRAFTMDYPNFFDRRENKTGSGIWLHAIPDSKSLTRGSRGCVVVRNNVIEKLEQYVELKRTPIIVQNEVEYISPATWWEQKKEVEAWLKNWKKSWESKNLDNYISFYHSEFKSLGMSVEKWREYKAELNKKYSFIKVNLDQIDVFKNGNQYIFRFLQDYSSDQNQDFGEKFLYVSDILKENSKKDLKILSEQWFPAKKATQKITASDSSADQG